ncbi:MAG: class I SAM-dependent methyltransferase [Xenococcaceae cyanobacterium MO_188.B19]|nr:class I SAM-dependent methyltransferase [Xenococcaceae cyanobacterium MO_188.B19]
MINTNLQFNNKLTHVIDNYIKFKIRKYNQIEGFLSQKEAIALYKIASILPKNSTIVEIGSWKGKSTYCLAKGIKSGKVIAIDPFDASGDDTSAIIYNQQRGKTSLLQQFKLNMIKLDVIHKIEIYQGYSQDFVGSISAIDFLFIDGDHSIEGCSQDFLNYSDQIKVGGYIAFHDYYLSRKELGPTWVIENKVSSSGRYKFSNLSDSLWIGQKIK